MFLNHVLLAVFWILFGVIHSVLASVGIKKMLKEKLGRWFMYYRLVYNIIAFLSLALIIFFQTAFASVYLFNPLPVTKVVGASVAVAGAGLMLICIKKYFAGLSGLKSLWQEETVTDELIISGVHRYVRHPLYLGTFAFLWGVVIWFPTISLLISTIAITAYTLIGIKYEEDKLIRYFGESYKAYKATVPKLIPRFLH